MTLDVTYSGPLPPPEILARYEKAFPGCAERILAAFEKEGEHRRQLDLADVKHLEHALAARTRAQEHGMVSARLVAILGLIVTAFIAWIGHPSAAVIIGGTELVGLVTVFILGRRVPPKEMPASTEK